MKTKLLISLLLISINGHSDERCNPEAVKAYFLPIKGATYHFTKNDMGGRDITYVSSRESGGDFYINEITDRNLGESSVKLASSYVISCNKAYLSGRPDPNNRLVDDPSTLPVERNDGRVQLLLNGKELNSTSWNWSYDGEDKKSRLNFMPKLTTKMRVFEDIAVVSTEQTYKGHSSLEKSYYARGFGLVKYDNYDDNGKIDGFLSDEIESIEGIPAKNAPEPVDSDESVPQPEEEQAEKIHILTADFGNGIEASFSTQRCAIPEYVAQGYEFNQVSSVPIGRVKNKNDAYGISGDRAYTVMGCWFKKEGNIIHAKMMRKHDGKVWEQDYIVGAGWYLTETSNGKFISTTALTD